MNPNTTTPGANFTTGTTISNGIGSSIGSAIGYVPRESVITIKKVSNGYILEANSARISVAATIDQAIELLRIAFNDNPQSNNSY